MSCPHCPHCMRGKATKLQRKEYNRRLYEDIRSLRVGEYVVLDNETVERASSTIGNIQAGCDARYVATASGMDVHVERIR